MNSNNQIPLYAATFLRFCANDTERDVLVLNKYCLEIVSVTNLPIVQDVVSPTERIIAVYSNKENLEREEDVEKSLTCQLDLTGCPLEVPFPINEFECSILSNSRHGDDGLLQEMIPLNMNEANALLRLFNDMMKHIRREEKTFSIPFVVVLCDGNDFGCTRAIAIRHLPLLTERARVTCKEDAVCAAKLLELDSIKKKHLNRISKCSQLDVSVNAKYTVIERRHSEDLSKSRILLECEWKSPQKVLEIPSGDAKCLIHFSIVFGDYRSPAFHRWEELAILQNLIACIEDQAFLTQNRNDEKSVFDTLINLTTELKMSFNKKKLGCKDKTEMFDLATQLTESRKDMDFTDKLWDVLRDCPSYEELQKCLKTILEIVAGGDLKPLIYSRNKSKLGSLISDIYHHKSELSSFNSDMCLQYLIEIGIEKLKLDYFHLFLASGLATKDVIDSFTSFQQGNFRDQLLSLKKLHLVTEIVAFTQNSISSSHGLLCSHVRLAIKQIKTLDSVGGSHSFSFAIDRQFLLQCLVTNLPCVWTLSLSAKQNSYSFQTVYRFSVDEPNRSINSSKMIKKSDINDEIYFTCVSTFVTDKCGM